MYMSLINLEEVLRLIEKISPHAGEYVNRAFQNGNIDIIYFSTEQNPGVFLIVDDECCIFYASFLNENNIENILDLIKNRTNEHILSTKSKEICFNVYGNNIKIINLIRELGFKKDMEGYHLQYNGYNGMQVSTFKEYNLNVKGFQKDMLRDFVNLFDKSYYQLYKDNGWKINTYSIHKEGFYEKLKRLDKERQVYSFWLDNKIIGAYIFDKNYITDIVVDPIFQNKGYGSYILAQCIKNMSLNRKIKNIRLRVAKSNIGAKKLYERNGFSEIACFAEHTYLG